MTVLFNCNGAVTLLLDRLDNLALLADNIADLIGADGSSKHFGSIF